jgi:hypothetical protein
LIQAQRDLVELRLREWRQVRASREVLPQEQVRVFVCAALPGTLRIAEKEWGWKDGDRGGLAEWELIRKEEDESVP